MRYKLKALNISETRRRAGVLTLTPALRRPSVRPGHFHANPSIYTTPRSTHRPMVDVECMEALGCHRRRLGRRFQRTCSRSDRRPFRAACKSTTSRLLHETQFTYIRQQLDGNPRRQWSTINELLQASA